MMMHIRGRDDARLRHVPNESVIFLWHFEVWLDLAEPIITFQRGVDTRAGRADMPEMPLKRTGMFGALGRMVFLAGCAGLATILCSFGPERADAQTQGEYQVAQFYPFFYQQPQPRRRYYRPRRRSYGRSVKVPKKPPAWIAEDNSKDPLQIIVSLPEQKLTVYKGDKALTTSKVSSGMSGYSTPAGVFSILERKPRHYSNIYGGAPMPFMQRLTWSGIALHASSSVPNRPASHGCVRLPNSFAPQLFQVTTKGVHVVVANEKGVAPKEISHPNLFQSSAVAPKDYDVVESERVARLDGIKVEEEERSTKPVRILVTRRTGRELFMEMQRMLNELQFGAGDVDGWMGPDTAQAIRRFQATYGLEKNGFMSPELMDKLYEVSGKGKPLNGHLYVRQNFKPVFDVPVLIKDGDKPLGSHIITAQYFAPDEDKVRWLSVTLTKGSGSNAAYGRQARKMKKAVDDIVLTESEPQPSSVEEAVGRIVVPDDVRERISEMLTPGSSLAITNDGISKETTPKGTDFVVLMQ
jgi:lipoprotein-anchoring transpeptidase ErfK/SrfK/peptidoglycan hydrolase-like protein with peptidoglycan-binding domain